MNERDGHLCLLAGTGDLPAAVQKAAAEHYASVSTIDIAGDESALLADPESLVHRLKATGGTHLVAAGGAEVSPEARRALAAWAVRSAGDTGPVVGEAGDSDAGALMTRLAAASGMVFVGPQTLLAGWLAGEGTLAGQASKGVNDLCRKALEVVSAIGATDLGQAVVCSGGRPIAAEGVEGTKGLLARVATYRAAGLVAGGAGLILAKAPRRGQSLDIDMPVLGPDTIDQCRQAGVGTIAVVAAQTLLIRKPELLAAAEEASIAILGLSVDG